MEQDRASDMSWLVNFASSETNKNGKKMSKVTLAFPVDALQGKVNKQDTAYFAKRNGRCYMNRIINPYTGDPTAKQELIQDKFGTVNTQVARIMKMGPGSDQYDQYKADFEKNPGKALTLRGYIFARNNDFLKDFLKEFTERQVDILKIISANFLITTQEIADKTGTTDRTIRNDIKTLKEKGLLYREGGRKDGRWILTGNGVALLEFIR